MDTGSALNVLNLDTFNRINKNNDGEIKLIKTSTKVLTYGENSPTLNVMGKTTLLIESDQKVICAQFYVINTNHRNLLNGDSAINLNLISFRLIEIQKN